MGFLVRALPVLMLVTCLTAACAEDDDRSCRSGDRAFPDGAIWTCADGCNGCSCEGGVITSTAAQCVSAPGPAANMLMCEEGGFTHRHGSSWNCSDGCGMCGCSDGEITRDQPNCGAAGAGAP